MKAVCSTRMNTQSSLMWCCVVRIVPDIWKALWSSETFVITHPMTWHCIAEDLNHQQHGCEKQKPNFLRNVGVILPQQVMSHPSRTFWISFLTVYIDQQSVPSLLRLILDPDSLVYNWLPGTPSPACRQLHVNLTSNIYLVSIWRMSGALCPCVCMCSHHRT